MQREFIFDMLDVGLNHNDDHMNNGNSQYVVGVYLLHIIIISWCICIKLCTILSRSYLLLVHAQTLCGDSKGVNRVLNGCLGRL